MSDVIVTGFAETSGGGAFLTVYRAALRGACVGGGSRLSIAVFAKGAVDDVTR